MSRTKEFVLVGVAGLALLACADESCPEGYVEVALRCVEAASGAPGDAAAGACSATQLDCDGDAGNGCETDVQSARNHCGACGNVCGWAPCVAGQCDDPMQLAVGAQHACALLKSGRVACWGDNPRGQLGNGEVREDLTMPQPPRYVHQEDGSPLQSVRQLTAGHLQSCALLQDGLVLCWGTAPLAGASLTSNTNPLVTHWAPIAVRDELSGGRSAPIRARAVAAGAFFTCALSMEGSLGCWGSNEFGQLAQGNTAVQEYVSTAGGIPAAADMQRQIVDFGMGAYHGCLILDDSSLACWGRNDFGQLAKTIPTPYSSLVPTRLVDAVSVPLTGVQQMVGGELFSCALLTSGEVRCFGRNHRGQVGSGGYYDVANTSVLPVVGVGGAGRLTGVRRLAAGFGFACALLQDKRVMCWGENSHPVSGALWGQLGVGQAAVQTRPTPDYVLNEQGIAPLADIEELSCYGNQCCARRASGAPLCWGTFGLGRDSANGFRISFLPEPLPPLVDEAEVGGS